jgi:folate-dependent phosphoribosylglycinamide formyltransferase PurN
MQLLFPEHNENTPARAAILMSGTGSNAEALIRYCRKNKCAFSPEVLLTDNPGCRAKELSQLYDIPLLELDIRKFYADRGEESIKLDTPRRQEIRNEWSAALYQLLVPFGIELVLLAGFIPLTGLTGMLPCLNVHPGDLTITDSSGRRLYAGLHYRPVEDAICNGCSAIRSSVILAQPYSGNGKGEMDSGPIIGVSERIPIDLAPETAQSLSEVRKKRIPGKRADDILRQKAVQTVEIMKVSGDHVIFPAAADDFARGRFACDENGVLFFRNGTEFTAILSVEYTPGGKKLLERSIQP